MKDQLPPILALKNFADLQDAIARKLSKSKSGLPIEAFTDAMAAPASLAYWLARRKIQPKRRIFRVAVIGAHSFDTVVNGVGYSHIPFLTRIPAKEIHIILIGPEVQMKNAYQHNCPEGCVQCHPVACELQHVVKDLIRNKLDAAMLFNPGFGSNNTIDSLLFGHHNSVLEDGSLMKLAEQGIPIGATAFVKMDAQLDIRELRRRGFKPANPERNPWGVTFPKDKQMPFIVPSWSRWLFDIA